LAPTIGAIFATCALKNHPLVKPENQGVVPVVKDQAKSAGKGVLERLVTPDEIPAMYGVGSQWSGVKVAVKLALFVGNRSLHQRPGGSLSTKVASFTVD
jgi:hypothetical protein